MSLKKEKLTVSTLVAKAKSRVQREKKPTAKQDAPAVVAAPIDVDGAFEALRSRMTKDTAGALVSSAESERLVIGIKVPALAIRGLLQQDVFPLGRSIMLYGVQGVGKSPLLFEIYAWFMSNSGLAAHNSNEAKDSPDLRNSILELYNSKFIDRTLVSETTSQEEWMRLFEDYFKNFEAVFSPTIAAKKALKQKKEETAEEFRKRKAPKENSKARGWIQPIVIGLDAITSTSSDKTIQDIKDEGAPKRRFAAEAMVLSDWAKALPEKLSRRPISFVFVNHDKPQKNDMGFLTHNIPGGRAMRFMASTEIEVTHLGREKRADYGANRVKLVVTKNALGPTGESIEVTMKWWWEVDPKTGINVQRTKWDWDTASIDYLLGLERLGKEKAAKLRNIVDLNAEKKRIWSKVLGIPQSNPVVYSEAGRLLEAKIQSDPVFRNALYNECHIKQRTKFVPGVDYRDVDAHIRLALEESRPIYTATDLTDVAYIGESLVEDDTKKPKKSAKLIAPADNDDDDEEPDGGD